MRKIYTEELIKEEVESLYNNEYKYLGMIDFKGRASKIRIYHNRCGREIEISFNNFLCRKNGCKYCYGTRIDEQKCKNMIEELSNGEYEMISKFHSIKDKVEILHKECNKTFFMTPADFIYNKFRCPHCSNHISYTEESIKEKISQITNKEYTCIDVNFRNGYKPKDSKIKVIHNKCNNIFTCITHNFINNNQRCPYCKEIKMFNPAFDSKGVTRIKNFLEENNIDYIKEKTFDDLISPFSNKKLRFDFYIPSKNILIEFDGKQHFKYNHTSNIMNKESFIKLKERDRIKNNYCNDNKINLIRIPYYDIDKIEEILKEIKE